MPFSAVITKPWLPYIDTTDTKAFAVFAEPWEAWAHLNNLRTTDEDEGHIETPTEESYTETRETLATLGTEAHWHHAETMTHGWLEWGIDHNGEGTVIDGEQLYVVTELGDNEWTRCGHCDDWAEFTGMSRGEPGRTFRCRACYLPTLVLTDFGDDEAA